jgi:hypothetical protein
MAAPSTPPDRLARLLAAGARFSDEAAVAPEDFLDAQVDPPFTWGELRALAATRRARVTAPDAAHVREQLAELLGAGARCSDAAAVAPEDFAEAQVDPPFTWGELRALAATRRGLLAATDAATAHAHAQLAEHLPSTTAAAAAETIRALLRARYGLPPALDAHGTPLHLVDEFGEAFKLTAEEEKVWRRLMTGGTTNHSDHTTDDQLDGD